VERSAAEKHLFLIQRAWRGKETPMFPFDAILFDVGGVLLTNGWDRAERAAAVEHFQLDAEDLEARHLSIFAAWERDAVGLEDYLDAAVFYKPRSFSRNEFFEFVLSQSKLLDGGALSVLEEIAASDQCIVGALNNEARATNDYRFSRFRLREYFQVAFSSCYLGLRKPDPAIYRRVLDILGAPPERVLFIDDREQNVEGAMAAGMKTIHFRGEGALRVQLTDLGVL
jgi:putative hydrolase of the HAD superfamily